jgi:hypothetical protein
MTHDTNLVDTFFPALDWTDTKIHLAQKSYRNRPIDVFTRSLDEWTTNWNGGYETVKCWNKKYIFSMIEIPTQQHHWLFGGVFEVLSCKTGMNGRGESGYIYKSVLTDNGRSMRGRVIIHYIKTGRNKARIAENILSDMTISEMLPDVYAGEDFPGLANINHSYAILEHLWRDAKTDWMTALTHCQGVYLITDNSTGLRYVGSAYGDSGIYSRWGNYFSTGGHGGNKNLKNLLFSKPNGADYARENFTICLLEHASSRDSEQHIIQRESYWKEVLLTRGQYGLNDN